MTFFNCFKYLATILVFCNFLVSCNYKFISNYTTKSKKQLKVEDKSFTASDGYTIAYSDNGLEEKPTLFFIHGYMVSRYNFFPLAKKFNDGNYRIIAVDVPGFGESTKIKNGDYKITSQAQRFLELIAHLKLENVNLVGTSMGGAIAIAMNGMEGKIKSNTLIAPLGMPLYSEELPGVMEYFIKTGKVAFYVDEQYNKNKTKKLMHFASNNPSFIIPSFLMKEIGEIFAAGKDYTNEVGKDILYDKTSLMSVATEHPVYSKVAKELNVNPESLDIQSEETLRLINKINKADKIKKIDPIGESYEPLNSYLEKIDNPVLVLWGKKDNIIHYKSIESMKPLLKKGTYKLYNCGSHSISMMRAKSISKEMKKIFQKNGL